MHSNKLRASVTICILGVMSYLVMLIEIPLAIFPFLKLDFSDLVVLCALVMLGIGGAAGVVIIRAVLHLIMTGFSAPALIGELGSVVASLTLILILALFLANFKKWSTRFLLIVIGTLSLTIVMAILNYFVLTPLYVSVTGFQLGMDYLKYVLITIIPFNLIKGGLLTGLFVILYAKAGNWMQRQRREFRE